MSLALGTAFPSGLGQGPGPSVLALLGEEHPQRCLPVPGWHGRKAGVDMLRASLPTSPLQQARACAVLQFKPSLEKER